MICYNEEGILGKSLSSVQWADEIVVVDSFSTDRSLEITKEYTHRVYQHDWQGYGKQKNLALTYAGNPWVLSLDADEVVSPELAREIQAVMTREPLQDGYRIPRKTCYLGRFLDHVWYPDYKVRLFRRNYVQWGEEKVHETLHLHGSVGTLRNPLLHYSFSSIQDHLETIQRYTTSGAEELAARGRRFSLFRLFVSPLAMFLKHYVMKRGFMDGLPGLIACILSGLHEFIKYAKLYERERFHSRPGPDPESR